MATKRTKLKLSPNAKFFAVVVIILAALMIFGGGVPQTAKYNLPIKLWTLNEYPAPFVASGRNQGILVVGADAPASDVIAAMDVASAIVAPLPNSTTMTVKLDTEVLNYTPYKTTNLILIGSSKVNRVIADVQSVKYVYDPSYVSSKEPSGSLTLRPSKYSWSKTILTVEGNSALGTRQVATVLKNYKTYKPFGRNCDIYTTGLVGNASAKIVMTCYEVPNIQR